VPIASESVETIGRKKTVTNKTSHLGGFGELIQLVGGGEGSKILGKSRDFAGGGQRDQS